MTLSDQNILDTELDQAYAEMQTAMDLMILYRQIKDSVLLMEIFDEED